MAEENVLDFDVGKAVAALGQLEKSLNKYSKEMRASVIQIAQMNKVQATLDQILDNSVSKAERAAKAQEKLTAARTKAANAAIAQQNAEKTVSNIKQDLGVQRTPSKITSIVRFDEASAQLEKLVASTGVTEARIKTILNNLSNDYKGAERKIRDSLVRLLQAQANLGGVNTDKARQALGLTADQVKSINDRAKELFLSWQSVTRIFIGQAIFRAVSAITRQIRESVSNAKKLQVALAEIQTLAPSDLQGDQSNVRRITTDLSNQFGIDQVEAASAVYEAFSNQVGDTADVVQFMGVTAEFATATITNLADAQDLLSGVMNAYGLANENAQRTADLLFKTIDLGRVRGEELANTFGRVAPLANQMGVELEEVLAILAATTIQGVKVDDALTQTQNIMKGLIKPTEALAERMTKLGIANAEVGVAQFGLVGFIKRISEGAKSVQDLALFFDDIRELRGVLSVLANEGQLFEASLRGIRDEADGAAEAAAKIVLDTPAKELDKSIQTFKNFFAEEVGNTLINRINDLVFLLGGAESAAKLLIGVLVTGGIAASAVLTGQLLSSLGSLGVTLGFVSSAAEGASLAIAGLQTLLGIGVFVAAAAGVVYFYRSLNDAKVSADDFVDSLERAKQASKEFADDAIEAQGRADRELFAQKDVIIKTALDILAERKRATLTAEEDAIRAEKNITKSLKTQVSERQKLIESFISNVKKSIEESVKNIEKIQDESRDIDFKLNTDRFGRNLDAADDDKQKASLLSKRITELLAAQEKAAKINENDFAKKLNDEAFRVATQLAELTGQRAKGEAALDKIVKARKDLNAELIQQETDKSVKAEETLATLENQNSAIEQQISKFNEIIDRLSKTDVSEDIRGNLQKELSDVGNQIQQSLINFGGTGLQGFEKDLAKIREEFTALDGTKIELDLLVDNSLSRVEELLSKVEFSLPVQLKITELTGIEGGRNQISDLQNEIVKIQDAAEKARTNAKGLGAQETNFRELTAALSEQLSLLEQLSVEIGEFGRDLPLGPAGLIDTDNTKNAREFAAELAKVQQELERISFVSAGDPAGLAEASELLSRFKKEQEAKITLPENVTVGLKTTQDTIDQIVISLEKIKEFQSQAQFSSEAFLKAEELTKLLQANREVELLNGTLRDTSAAATQGIDPAKSKAQEFLNVQQLQINAQRQLNDLIRSQPAPNANPVQRSLGGMIYRADGGFTPRGTDTIPAMLSPGEWVVDAANTRKFYSQLQSISAGIQPVYRQEGGPVTNNSFGDININLPPGSNQTDGRAAVSAIRREFRRKSSSPF